jgi:anti-sigma factor RsiW
MNSDLSADVPNLCNLLDAYFDGDLTPRDAIRFEDHLAECARCHAAAEQQSWIDGLLQSSHSAQLEAAPATVRRVGRPRRAARWVAVAAVVAGFAAGAWAVLAVCEPFGASEETSIADSAPVQIDQRMAASSVQETGGASAAPATFVTSGRDIAIPVESPSANVTVVRLYPTVGSRLERSSMSYLVPPSGQGDEL